MEVLFRETQRADGWWTIPTEASWDEIEAADVPVGLSSLQPSELLGALLTCLLERTGVGSRRRGDVIGGCVTQTGEQGVNVTRNAWIAAGLPWDVPATSVDRQCGSSQQAVHFGAAGVAA